ncbi:hypothetical protein BpJC7_05410 [Weizmannia acidilactici]|uniref:Uncharacterized protein n=1 Tax=Weizmannia acidilactici TaxID=2607726 RepID=A0A5J4JFZ9_9BACI|nr:hypothetical protein BpJC4_05970 [Weizmannia acidilactici]GER69238.1 hypothetical protein BpJC7_05410 [Weizmannia acidilactici]
MQRRIYGIQFAGLPLSELASESEGIVEKVAKNLIAQVKQGEIRQSAFLRFQSSNNPLSSLLVHPFGLAFILFGYDFNLALKRFKYNRTVGKKPAQTG